MLLSGVISLFWICYASLFDIMNDVPGIIKSVILWTFVIRAIFEYISFGLKLSLLFLNTFYIMLLKFSLYICFQSMSSSFIMFIYLKLYPLAYVSINSLSVFLAFFFYCGFLYSLYYFRIYNALVPLGIFIHSYISH